VADQERTLDPGRVEHPGEVDQPLVVHVAERPRQRHRIRAAVAGPAVHQRAAAGLGRQRGREVAPHADAAQPLVQEDQRGRVGRAGPVPRVLQALVAREEGLAHRPSVTQPGMFLLYGRITTFTHPSALALNILYASGASSSPTRWVTMNEGSSSLASTLSSSGLP